MQTNEWILICRCAGVLPLILSKCMSALFGRVDEVNDGNDDNDDNYDEGEMQAAAKERKMANTRTRARGNAAGQWKLRPRSGSKVWDCEGGRVARMRAELRRDESESTSFTHDEKETCFAISWND